MAKERCGLLWVGNKGWKRFVARKPAVSLFSWKGCDNIDFDFIELFPRCGEQGTVRNLLKDTSLQGKIALKSGSMRGVKCYAGYALNDDGLPTHVIVVMVNEYNGNIAKLKKAIESFLLNNIS